MLVNKLCILPGNRVTGKVTEQLPALAGRVEPVRGIEVPVGTYKPAPGTGSYGFVSTQKNFLK
jgi:hypothetical protein